MKENYEKERKLYDLELVSKVGQKKNRINGSSLI